MSVCVCSGGGGGAAGVVCQQPQPSRAQNIDEPNGTWLANWPGLTLATRAHGNAQQCSPFCWQQITSILVLLALVYGISASWRQAKPALPPLNHYVHGVRRVLSH